MKLITLILTALILPLSALAHEGHDHTPGAKTAPHGGVLQKTGGIHLELVSKGENLQLFAYDEEMNPLLPKDVGIEGSMTLPKKSKATQVKFAPDGDALTAKVDAKGAHRYTLNLLVTLAGKKDKATFNVEP